MKQVNMLLVTALLIISGSIAKAQPIPVELMMGDKYGTVNLTFSKSLKPNSKFGFFHMNTVQFDYKEEYKIASSYRIYSIMKPSKTSIWQVESFSAKPGLTQLPEFNMCMPEVKRFSFLRHE
mgnify:CR=1 FL=1